MTWGVVGLDGKPTQLISTKEQPLDCVRCGTLLGPGKRALCPDCVEKVNRQRGRAKKSASETEAMPE